MENTPTLNPATLADPLIRLAAWIAQLFMAPQTIRVVDENLDPMTDVALVDLETGFKGRTKPMTGTCKCRGITDLCCFTESGDALRLWDDRLNDWVPSVRIPAAARRVTFKAKLP